MLHVASHSRKRRVTFSLAVASFQLLNLIWNPQGTAMQLALERAGVLFQQEYGVSQYNKPCPWCSNTKVIIDRTELTGYNITPLIKLSSAFSFFPCALSDTTGIMLFLKSYSVLVSCIFARRQLLLMNANDFSRPGQQAGLELHLVASKETPQPQQQCAGGQHPQRERKIHT